MHLECVFVGQRVAICGQRFERCLFKNCELVFDGGPTHLVGNDFDGCSWSFEGAAANTLTFVSAMCAGSPEFGMMIAKSIGFIHERPN